MKILVHRQRSDGQVQTLTKENSVRTVLYAEEGYVLMRDEGDTKKMPYRAEEEEGIAKASQKNRAEKNEISEIILKEAMIQPPLEYREMKNKRYKAKRKIIDAVIALLVAMIILAVSTIVRTWQYMSYSVLVTNTKEKEETLSFEYCGVDKNILKYSLDSASMRDRNYNTIWNISYKMQCPTIAVCKKTIAIYDKNGTDICICNATGKIGNISVKMPIVKATVGRQGVVAVIMEKGDNTWIQSYDKSGCAILTIETTMDSLGYPMDLSLSDDSMLLGVSYLYFENGMPRSRICFYNVGNVGQKQIDNRVCEYEYSNIIIPQLEYLDRHTCIAFQEDGFTIFEGVKIPKEYKKITIDREIVSTFYDQSHIGLILNNEDSETAFQLIVYNKNGREILRENMNFEYQEIELVGNQIVMYNKSTFCVCSLSGMEKFKGGFKDLPRKFFPIKQNRFVMITQDGCNLIKLR